MIKIRIRVIVGIMIFLGYFLVYVVRYNLSVHIVDIVQIAKRLDESRNDLISVLKHVRGKMITRSGNYIEVLNWSQKKIANLLGAYHIGYCICFPIFHNIGDRLGPTWIVGIAGILSGVLNILTPASVYYSYWVLFIVRILSGFCAGAMQPSMVQVLRHWVPPIERNHFMWAYCGITMGTCSTFLMCAAVHRYSRWPVGFYVCGAVQIAWSVAWICVVTDCPAKHSFISKGELTYLTNTVGTVFTIKLTNTQAPWRLILKSIAFWALCILNFGYAWMIISLCLHGPLYYTMIQYSVYDASAITALPFFLRMVVGTIVIQTFHYYKPRMDVKRIQYIRKYFIVVSHVVPGLLVMSTWMVTPLPGPIILTTAITLTAAGMDLTLDICYELTPTYANSINTVIKIVGNAAGIIVAYGVGGVTHTYQDKMPYVWKNIWCFHGLVLCLSGIVFLIWGETCLQPWNNIRGRIRPRRKVFVRPKASVMSNITEVEENNSSIQSLKR